MLLNGTGTYYFRVRGAKDQPLFYSVFEYDYFRNIVANVNGGELIAYVFSEDEAQWVMQCHRDWQDILDDIQAEVQEQYFRLWHKHHQVISGNSEVLFIDPEHYLVPLVMDMHTWPVRQHKVASPDVYPWSSDSFYRENDTPDWLHAGYMRNRLAHQRFSCALRYERIMETPVTYDVLSQKHRLYEALADDACIAQHLRHMHEPQEMKMADCERLRRQSEDLVCNILGIDRELTEHQRRLFHQVEPLSMFLMHSSGCSIEQISVIFGCDEPLVEGWLRNVPYQHPEAFLKKLADKWQESLHTEMPLSEVS